MLKVSFSFNTIRRLSGNHDDAGAAEKCAAAVAKKIGAPVAKFKRAVLDARSLLQAYRNAYGALTIPPQEMRAALRLASRLAGELHKFTAVHQLHSKSVVRESEVAITGHLAMLRDQYAALADQKSGNVTGRPTSVNGNRHARKLARKLLDEYLPVTDTRSTTRRGRAAQVKERAKRHKIEKTIVSAILN